MIVSDIDGVSDWMRLDDHPRPVTAHDGAVETIYADRLGRVLCPWEKARKRPTVSSRLSLTVVGNGAQALLAGEHCSRAGFFRLICHANQLNLLGYKERNPTDKDSSALKLHRKRRGRFASTGMTLPEQVGLDRTLGAWHRAQRKI